MTDFKSLLIDLQQKSNPINVAIPEVGIISVLIKSIQKDIVSLQPTSPLLRILFTYTTHQLL